MERDFQKFTEWLEKTVRAGVADEQALRELKLAQKRATRPLTQVYDETLKEN